MTSRERLPACSLSFSFPRPVLTRAQDGNDNTVADSRWSCDPGLVGDFDYCMLFFDLGGSFTVSYIMICKSYLRHGTWTTRDWVYG